jgi:hypothetical protein
MRRQPRAARSGHGPPWAHRRAGRHPRRHPRRAVQNHVRQRTGGQAGIHVDGPRDVRTRMRGSNGPLDAQVPRRWHPARRAGTRQCRAPAPCQSADRNPRPPQQSPARARGLKVPAQGARRHLDRGGGPQHAAILRPRQADVGSVKRRAGDDPTALGDFGAGSRSGHRRATLRRSAKGRGVTRTCPTTRPAARASRRAAQACARGSANSITDSLPTVALTRGMSVACSTTSTLSHVAPSSAQAICFSAVAMFCPISARGSVRVKRPSRCAIQPSAVSASGLGRLGMTGTWLKTPAPRADQGHQPTGRQPPETRAAASDLLCRGQDRGADPRIGATSAQVSVHGRIDIISRGIGHLFQQRDRRHDLPGLTISALRHPWSSQACCTGCRASPLASPSIVRTLRPSTSPAEVMQARVAHRPR